MTIFYFALKRSFGNLTNLIFLSLTPIVCIFFPVGEYWPLLPYGYQYYGIVILFAAIRLTSLILEDRAKGVIKRLSVAPISYFRYLSQNLLAYSVILIIQCAIVVGGGLIWGQELYQPLSLLILYISFSFTALALALAWITLYRNKDSSFLVYMALIFLVVVMGGVMIPLEMFPDLLKRVAVLLPTFWLSEGLNWVANGDDATDFLLINGVLWLYTLIFVVIGSTRRMQ
ncbi:ABC transporter permease [Paenibacillus sp. 1011MAR3C5]|uniref:ABC transporter permease n=1 Tax=Paenibacillus sp. 1011MAR3C5 TaxID=1675787 RepID=UPI000E6BA045|nr:ABC transporter permease [Paenibacillus sp. 1011MAR3C5]RJE90271.1 ABC transporter permease [Paenibacillus sp. 1011MAR3C5]